MEIKSGQLNSVDLTISCIFYKDPIVFQYSLLLDPSKIAHPLENYCCALDATLMSGAITIRNSNGMKQAAITCLGSIGVILSLYALCKKVSNKLYTIV